MAKKGIKTKLMRAIPNNGELNKVNFEIFELNGIKYIIWGASRSGSDIWIEMESDDPFGVSMQGRYYTNYVDVNPDLYPQILKSLGVD